MLKMRRKRLFWMGASLLFVGLAFLILPPYSAYCEGHYANKYYCSPYEFVVALVDGAETYNGFLTALATIAIAGFTLTLKWSTDKLWLSAEKQFQQAIIDRGTDLTQIREQIDIARQSADAAKRAAEATELSARAAIAIELPIIKMSLSALANGSTTYRNGTRAENVAVHFVTFTNVGRTKAFPVKLHYGFAVGKLPEKPQYPFIDPFQYDDIFEAPNPKEFKKYLSQTHDLPVGTWTNIISGSLPVWFFCELIYFDFMQDRERDAQYCWRWHSLGLSPGWRPDETPAYNH